MRVEKHNESGIYNRDIGQMIPTLLRMGTRRGRRAAAVIAIALFTLNQCAALAYAEATNTTLYLDAPSVSEDRASAAGKVAGEYALSVADPSRAVLAGLAMTTSQQGDTIEVADLPDETGKAFATIISENPGGGITADAALGAGETMLAQLGDEQEDDGAELASRDAVRPRLGEPEQPRPDTEDENSPLEYASTAPDEAVEQSEAEPDTEGDGASLVVEQPEPEAADPENGSESVEYASASPEVGSEDPPADTTSNEEYGAAGPITDTAPADTAPLEPVREETAATPSPETAESEEITPDTAEFQIPSVSENPQPAIEPETQDPAEESEISEETYSLEESDTVSQPTASIEDPESEGDEAATPVIVPVQSSLPEEVTDDPEASSVSAPDDEDPYPDSDDAQAETEDTVETVEQENVEIVAVEDSPEPSEPPEYSVEIPAQNEPDSNTTSENDFDVGNPQSVEENTQPDPVPQETPPSVITQGGRNSGNGREDIERRRLERPERGGDRETGEGRRSWRHNIPEQQTVPDANRWDRITTVTSDNPQSVSDPPQVVVQESLPATVQPQVIQEAVYQQAIGSSQGDYGADMSGVQPSPEYVAKLRTSLPATPEITVDQAAPAVSAPEQLTSPTVEQQVEQVMERVADLDVEVGE